MPRDSTFDTCDHCGAARWASNLPPEARGVIHLALQTHESVMVSRGADVAADLAYRVRLGMDANAPFSLVEADGLDAFTKKRWWR